jgi:hypothetical protein
MSESAEELILAPDVGRALELAACAIGRLDARVQVSPVRRAWLRRSTFLAAVRAIEADGYLFEVERLFALAANLPVPRLMDYGTDTLAVDILGRVLALKAAAEGERAADQPPPGPDLEKALETLRLAQRTGPVLAGALAGLRHWITQDGRPSLGLVAFAEVLAERGLTQGPVPWLASALPSRAILPDGLSAARWTRRALQEVAGTAEAGSRLLAALETTREAWYRRLGARRATSRLHLVVELALAYPVLSPVQVSGLLGISVRGASMLLDQLADLEILLPPKREGSWRFFIAADLRDIRSHVLGEAPTAPAPVRKIAMVAPAPALPLGPLPTASRKLKPIEEPKGFRDLLASTDDVVRRITDRLAQVRGKVPIE